MEKYYLKTSINRAPKNQAWIDAQEFATGMDGTLVSGETEKKRVIELIREKVDEINLANPRCKYLYFHTMAYERCDTSVYVNSDGDEAFSIVFYPVKRELL